MAAAIGCVQCRLSAVCLTLKDAVLVRCSTCGAAYVSRQLSDWDDRGGPLLLGEEVPAGCRWLPADVIWSGWVCPVCAYNDSPLGQLAKELKSLADVMGELNDEYNAINEALYAKPEKKKRKRRWWPFGRKRKQ